MSKFLTTFFVLLSQFAFASTSVLADDSDLNKDLRYQVSDTTLTLSNSTTFNRTGQAEFSYLFWDVYESYLYKQSGTFVSDAPWHEQGDVILEIRYKRDIKAKDLIDSTIEQWQHLKVPKSEYETFVPWLTEIWPDLKDGDRLALYKRDDNSVFFYNGELLAVQAAPSFARIFLDIWLSINTSEPKLRKKLLSIK